MGTKQFNAITTWQHTDHATVRMAAKTPPIATFSTPDLAIWAAERLNLCARLEAIAVQMLDGASDLDVWDSLKELRATGKL